LEQKKITIPDEFDPTHLTLLISPENIAEKIRLIARRLDSEFAGEELVILMVMKGAICFVADLIRELHLPNSLEFVSASSYGMKGVLSGEVKLSSMEDMDLRGRNVLIVDDIFDTGKTLAKVLHAVEKKHPKKVKSLFLLSKKKKLEIVVGYGLDYKEQYRGLKGIYYSRTK
jgi:hypoxanthine phosphoribosyltransferase